MSGTAQYGGMSTTYLSAEESERRRRAERDADARAYLTRKGYVDLLPILGLAPETCGNCGAPIVRPEGKRGYCDKPACRVLRTEGGA